MISRCMSTQHPDNASAPFFSDGPEISGEAEITEAYYAYSHLNCREQLWDCEGKESDSYVVKKLFTSHEDFFRKNVLGKDFFLTLRVPNPDVEKSEAKLLVEALASIPRSFDVSKRFYGEDVAPIFEVALPMAGSAEQLSSIHSYYEKFIAGQQNLKINGKTVREWIGPFKPETISVIPLFETRDQILEAGSIVREYLRGKNPEYQRVWFARSDPSLNYGNLAAVLYNKVAMQRLKELESEISVPLHPIIGMGSCPFRGNLKPTNVKDALGGYPSVRTFTTQSAFKYDYEADTVAKAFETFNESGTSVPVPVDEETCVRIADKTRSQYFKEVALAAPLVNQLSGYVPARRKRKLHIGLFGYSRKAGEVSLPRTITFCASLYSVGFPPELLGLSAATPQEKDLVRKNYKNFDSDLEDAARYYNPECASVLPREIVRNAEFVLDGLKVETDEKHAQATSEIISLIKRNRFQETSKLMVQAAKLRKFLG